MRLEHRTDPVTAPGSQFGLHETVVRTFLCEAVIGYECYTTPQRGEKVQLPESPISGKPLGRKAPASKG